VKYEVARRRFNHAKAFVIASSTIAQKVKIIHVGKKADSRRLAVVVHVFYPDMWPEFQQRLDSVAVDYDLFITTTQGKENEVASQLSDAVSTTILTLPNKGRDILPFLSALKIVKASGYTKLLKLHTKKSPHRRDGGKWSVGMVESLLPEAAVVNNVMQLLDDPLVGIIGPKGEYLQLSVNFEANGLHMSYIMRRLYGRKRTFEILQEKRLSYGFFAGSMFWARVDAFDELVEKKLHRSVYFEKESGQVDATFAHAVERVFSLMCEAEGKRMFEVSSGGVVEIRYETQNVPDWSGVYIGPAAE
jgi:lipopolysaccharide biosynthesis protein